MKKTKSIPAIVMLLGCAVAAIVTYINGYGLQKMLKVILVSLLIFLCMGMIIKFLFDKYIPPIEEEEVTDDEGSVIEKTSEEEPIEGEEGEEVPEIIDEESLS